MAMDAYYLDYKGNGEFFDLDDFIRYCGSSLADFYRQEWAAKYAELKAEKSDSLVAFGDDVLETVTVKADKTNEGFYVADFPESVMSFTYDTQSSGIQSVRSREYELERVSASLRWQLDLIPFTGKLFWYPQGKRIIVWTNGLCNVQELEISYVPGISNKMIVPDGIIKYTVDTTVTTMRGIEQGKVVKETNDGNQNRVMESEINKAALK